MTSTVPCQPRKSRRPAQGSSPVAASTTGAAKADNTSDSRGGSRPLAASASEQLPGTRIDPGAACCDAPAPAPTQTPAQAPAVGIAIRRKPGSRAAEPCGMAGSAAAGLELTAGSSSATDPGAACGDAQAPSGIANGFSAPPQAAAAHGAAINAANAANGRHRAAGSDALSGSSRAPGDAPGADLRRRNRPSAELVRRNRRVESYQDLVRPLALHYACRCTESCEDLIQVGMLGLIRAAELYRSETGTPFEAFARPHIRGAILHYLRDEAPSVRLPRRQAELQERLQRLESRDGAPLDPGRSARLRRQLGIDESHWSLLQRQRRLCRPLPLEGALVEELAAPDDREVPQRCVEVGQLLAELEPRQRQVVRQVILDGCSYRRLAKQMQVSPMTVQRLLHRGLERLRQQLEQRSLSSDRSEHPAASGLPAW